MKVMVLFVVVLMLANFGFAELGDDWDSFSGNDSSSSSVDVNMGIGSSNNGATSDDYSGGGLGGYTQDFYIALGVGGVGLLIVAVFLYFFFKKPRNRWERKTHK